MPKTIVNLTMPLVVETIETTLETFPRHPYRQAFANPDLRRKLVAYVLSHVPNIYDVVDDMETVEPDYSRLCLSRKDRATMKSAILQGIHNLLDSSPNEIAHHLPNAVDAGRSPSHWFG
ncbi:MAG: hypothetical protein ACFB8W_05105 [Elainellaceae cyanobacterium]